jgi:hypothetical protein
MSERAFLFAKSDDAPASGVPREQRKSMVTE